MTKKNTPGKKRVLSDHKQVGKTLISPMNSQLGELGETRWMHLTLPELLWIDLLSRKLGEVRTLEILKALFKEANQRMPKKFQWGCFASSYSLLSEQSKSELLSILDTGELLSDIQSALGGFHTLYPKCPLHFLTPGEPSTSGKKTSIQIVKKRVEELTNKRSRPAIIMQANAIYTAATLGWMKFQRESLFSEFHLLDDYPRTEKSKMIGASICAVMNSLVAVQVIDSNLLEWSTYFWNQGLTIEPIDFSYMMDGYESS